MDSWFDRLQRNAQNHELSPLNTSPRTFVGLSVTQLIVTMLISRWLDESRPGRFFTQAAEISYAFHLGGYAVSLLIGSCKYFDITEDIGLLVMFWYSHATIRRPTESQSILHGCAIVWCVRLMLFVGYRVLVRGRDFRFEKLIKEPGYNLFGWVSGGTWCWLNGFALWVCASVPAESVSGLNLFSGITIWAIGICVEIVSDVQKYRFNASTPSGKQTTWIATGLWTWSRHPNYLGEIMLWTGFALACVGDVRQRTATDMMLIAITPIWSLFFLVFTSLMLLEKSAERKWGASSAWKRYKRRTPVLLPSRFPTPREALSL